MSSDGDRRPPVLLHPAFELTPDLIVFTFRENVVSEGRISTRKVRVLRDQDSVCVDTSEAPVIRIGGMDAIFHSRYEYPPMLDDQWSRVDLDEFLRTRTALAPSSIYAELVAAFQRHSDLKEHGAYVVAATWVALTFVYPAFPAVPFLLFLGPKATGKSQTLDVLANLCRCGHKSRPRPAALGDLIESQRAIPIIDQANSLDSELLQIAIDSYRRGASRTVTDVDNRGQPHRFETFGPKVFAAHERFDDDLADRCIQFTMAPATREIEPILADDDRLQRLRWEMYKFTLKHHPDLFEAMGRRKRDIVGRELEFGGRDLELWWPFEVLFEWLTVPDLDREDARRFFNASLNSTKAELDEKTRALLLALAVLAKDSVGDFEARSDEVAGGIKAILGTGVDESWIGSSLKDLGLALKKRRTRCNGRRLMVWKISASSLRHLLVAWKLLDGEVES